MEILPPRTAPKNLGTGLMTRTIRHGPRGKELDNFNKSLNLPTERRRITCPKHGVCQKCKAKKQLNTLECRYIQPSRRQDYAPEKCYRPPEEKLDTNTIYKMSYDAVKSERPDKFIPDNNIVTSKAKFSTATINKCSFPGWYNQPKQCPFKPCSHDFRGKGPLATDTTNRCDFIAKSVEPVEPFAPTNHLYLPAVPFSCKTINKMSYEPIEGCHRREPYLQDGSLTFPCGPVETQTIHKMSYQEVKIPKKDFLPWAQKKPYQIPSIKMVGDTIYKKSYIPNLNFERVQPIVPCANQTHCLGPECPMDTNTIYHMSYMGSDGVHRPPQVKPINNICVSKQKIEDKTINKMSYKHIPDYERAAPVRPCHHDLLGHGPMENETTSRRDYVPKDIETSCQFRPEQQLYISQAPMDSRTINKMSFMEPEPIERSGPVRPVNQIYIANTQMEKNTIHKMSYQPVQAAPPEPKPWMDKQGYCPPNLPFASDTCYRMSYEAPGDWIDCEPPVTDDCCCDCPPVDCQCTCLPPENPC